MTDFLRDPDTIREAMRRWISGEDRIEPPEDDEPERPYFDERDHYPDLVRFRP